MRGIPVSEKYRGIKSDTVLCTSGLLNTALTVVHFQQGTVYVEKLCLQLLTSQNTAVYTGIAVFL